MSEAYAPITVQLVQDLGVTTLLLFLPPTCLLFALELAQWKWMHALLSFHELFL